MRAGSGLHSNGGSCSAHILCLALTIFALGGPAYAQATPDAPPAQQQLLEDVVSPPAEADAPPPDAAQDDAELPVDAPADGVSANAEPTEVAAPPVTDSLGNAPMIEHGLDHDLSVWGMFMMADIVVKAVMIGLATAALLTWILWVGKSLQLSGAKARARRALRAVEQAANLDAAVANLGRRKGVGALLVHAADGEMKASSDLLSRISSAGIKERVSSRLSRIEAAAGRKIAQGTGLLASIGSVAPFVGLFGTVWGIMNSFISIAESQTTNLAVVAPGIAEALLATAIGLVAAIPAVILYNVFARSITSYRQLLADVSAGIERLVSRDIDRHALNASASDANTIAAE